MSMILLLLVMNPRHYEIPSLVLMEFAIKELDKLNYFLGLKIPYTTNGMFVSQVKYAHDILERAELLDSKPVSTPLTTGESLVSTGPPFRDPTLYRSLVDALQDLINHH